MNIKSIEPLPEQTGEIQIKRYEHSLTPVTVTLAALIFGASAPAAMAYDGDTRGRRHARPEVVEIGKQGGTELFLESGEPEFCEQSLEEVLAIEASGNQTLSSSFFRTAP